MKISMGNYIGKVEIEQGKIVDQWLCEVDVNADEDPQAIPKLMTMDFVANGSVVRAFSDGENVVGLVDRSNPQMISVIDPMRIINNGTYEVDGVKRVNVLVD